MKRDWKKTNPNPKGAKENESENKDREKQRETSGRGDVAFFPFSLFFRFFSLCVFF